jgi:hypothetical protein
MSLFPVVSSLDAVDANYLTMKTAEGFLVHYHDLQRLEEPGASPTPVIPAPATDSNHVRIIVCSVKEPPLHPNHARVHENAFVFSSECLCANARDESFVPAPRV